MEWSTNHLLDVLLKALPFLNTSYALVPSLTSEISSVLHNWTVYLVNQVKLDLSLTELTTILNKLPLCSSHSGIPAAAKRLAVTFFFTAHSPYFNPKNESKGNILFMKTVQVVRGEVVLVQSVNTWTTWHLGWITDASLSKCKQHLCCTNALPTYQWVEHLCRSLLAVSDLKTRNSPLLVARTCCNITGMNIVYDCNCDYIGVKNRNLMTTLLFYKMMVQSQNVYKTMVQKGAQSATPWNN